MFTRRARGSAFQLALSSNAKRKSSSVSSKVLATKVLSNSSLKEVALRIPSIPYNKQNLYKFKDETLERRVYTHSSAGTQQNSWSSDEVVAKTDNEHLEFVGDGLLKGLTAHLIDTLFPEMNEGGMSTLMAALINNRFYAHMARQLGLADRLVTGITAGSKPFESDRVLGGLFEAFVGGMHKDMGMERYQELYLWFNALMKPYALAFQKEFDAIAAKQVREMSPPTSGATNPYLSRKEPEPVSENFTYAQWLHEYTTMNYLTMPDYSFLREGPRNCTSWKCVILLDNQKFVGPPEPNKHAAKNMACKQVHDFVCSWSQRRG